MFTKFEINYLRKLYDEEIAHFRAVLVDRFTDVLFECGEKWSKNRIMKLFRGYADNEVQCTGAKVFVCGFVVRLQQCVSVPFTFHLHPHANLPPPPPPALLSKIGRHTWTFSCMSRRRRRTLTYFLKWPMRAMWE